jgi:hypothetical protein
LTSEKGFFYHSTPRGKRKEKERKERRERERKKERKRRKKKGRRGQKEEINDSFCMWQLGREVCFSISAL